MFKKVVSIIFIGLIISIFFTTQTYAMGNMGGNNGNNGNQNNNGNNGNNGNQNNNGNNGKNNGNKGKTKKNKSVPQNIKKYNKKREINQKREYRVREFCNKNKEICIKNRKEMKTYKEKMLIAIGLIDAINKYRKGE